MAAVDALEIENRSDQIINIIVARAPQRGFDLNNETFSTTTNGVLGIAPKKKVTVQEARVNLGQIASFEEKGLVKVTRTRISSS